MSSASGGRYLSDRCQGVLRGVVSASTVRHRGDAVRPSRGSEDESGLVLRQRRKAEHGHEDIEEGGEEGRSDGAPRPQYQQKKERREAHCLVPELQHG